MRDCQLWIPVAPMIAMTLAAVGIINFFVIDSAPFDQVNGQLAVMSAVATKAHTVVTPAASQSASFFQPREPVRRERRVS